MNEIKSIWDGWEKQAFDMVGDRTVGSHCAMGYVWHVGGVWDDEFKARIARGLRKSYAIPSSDIFIEKTNTHYFLTTTNSHVIFYANNVLKLTPEDFRRIDRETQIEEALKSVERVSQVTPELAEATCREDVPGQQDHHGDCRDSLRPERRA